MTVPHDSHDQEPALPTVRTAPARPTAAGAAR
jgi:hypothetical protein